MRGRKRKPRELHIVEDTLRKDRHGARGLDVSGELPVCPPWLSATAAKEWHRLLPELDRLGIISKTDTGVLAAYCMAWGKLRSTELILRKQGLVIRCGVDGTSRKPHPALTIQRTAVAELRQLAGELGLSPTARERLSGDDDAGDPDDDDYFG